MKTLAKTLSGVVLLFVIGYVFNFYKRYPADRFCSGVSSTDTEQSIIRRAKQEGRHFLPSNNSSSRVLVFNQVSPAWRYACVIEFSKGKVSSKRVIAAD
ncbi:hypothetical protein [Pseudoxanthomonas sangjuensis]|uniref:hypothetical protein n=1 Tax=Pseudoxanthomonas sangjuensis TaxID=1503750 RepID=UPI00139198C2|nr:hypothetical protein [Pseudoxanthomonas sangjuensis]